MIWAIVTLAICGFLASFGLGLASKKFSVTIDPRIEKIEELLPGANCGACGYPGCSGFAAALVKGEADISRCVALSSEAVEKIAEILGKKVEIKEKLKAYVACKGSTSLSSRKYNYNGISDCFSANLLFGGDKSCSYGCLGYGTCEKVCPFSAITMTSSNLPKIDWSLCVGCGKCVEACPKGIIKLVPQSAKVLVLCNSHEKGAKVKSVCKVGCIACRKCEKVCPENAIKVKDFLAEIDYKKCTGCGKCVEICPQKVIEKVIIQ